MTSKEREREVKGEERPEKKRLRKDVENDAMCHSGHNASFVQNCR